MDTDSWRITADIVDKYGNTTDHLMLSGFATWADVTNFAHLYLKGSPHFRHLAYWGPSPLAVPA